MRLTANKIAGILRQHGYRLTPQRHAVLKAIASSQDCVNPAEICTRVRQEYPTIGMATIYRSIKMLADLSLVCRVNPDSRSRNYLMRRSMSHHHHLVCSQCGRTIDFTHCDLSQLEKRLTRETGFIIEGHILEIYGRCPECCAASPVPNPR